MIGILYICTGKYDLFWKDFYESSQKFFLPSQEKKYFVFTDASHLYGEDKTFVKKIHQESLGWPYNTLMRFDIFLKVHAELRNCEYLFFFNANIIFIDFVNNDILPNKNNDGLVAANHPGFWNKTSNHFTYERNIVSTAYIPYGAGKYYYFGALNGGESNAYLEMIQELNTNIHKDLKKGVIALWHDESHLNHYLLNKSPKVLSPSYCYPQESQLPFKPKILVLDKSRYGGHAFLRGITETPTS
ncbi:family 6 glucosyltransferase [Pedobacter sp. AW31-3R]|uniref:family 6 glucosyltransferase n=1 Tax=Pedobacter sp. AW31-3R TaxID=3445781 RepID=UPI003FA10D99